MKIEICLIVLIISSCMQNESTANKQADSFQNVKLVVKEKKHKNVIPKLDTGQRYLHQAKEGNAHHGLSGAKGTTINNNSSDTYISQLEMEVNNGGFNQYFFNSSGENCFEALRALKRKGKIETAKLLEKAIDLINPNHLSEKDLVTKLRNMEVEELDDERISAELDKLDYLFYEYPDGSLNE